MDSTKKLCLQNPSFPFFEPIFCINPSFPSNETKDGFWKDGLTEETHLSHFPEPISPILPIFERWVADPSLEPVNFTGSQ